MAATHKDQVETMSKTQEHFSRPRPMQLKLQPQTTPNNTDTHRQRARKKVIMSIRGVRGWGEGEGWERRENGGAANTAVASG
jgi:hypothetical protein